MKANSKRALLVASLLLAGCGGGGGGGSKPPVPALSVPKNVRLQITNGQLVVSWASVAGAKSYKVYVGLSPNVLAEAKNLFGEFSGLTATHSGTPKDKRHYFVVTAVDGSRESGRSAEVVGIANGGDEYFGNQWHLENTGQNGAKVGEDARAKGAWTAGYTGKGVRVAIVDDGVDARHEDLKGNLVPGKSYNYIDKSTDPTPKKSTNGHGTNVAGVTASVGMNGVGTRGVAYAAELVGYNPIATDDSADDTEALTRDMVSNAVLNCSHGPDDDGTFAPQSIEDRLAIESGLRSGRGGKGLIYVLSAGNGRAADDQNGLDENLGHFGVLGIGSINDQGKASFFSEQGPNLWVVAPGGGLKQNLSTTDLLGSAGENTGATPGKEYSNLDYSKQAGGCSFAAPVVSGVVALMLQARPQLGWRDVREILARTARKNDPTHQDWMTNAAGVDYNDYYGFGAVDAARAVALAKTWTLITAPAKTATLSSPSLNAAIPDNATFRYFALKLSATGIAKIEHVSVQLELTHDKDLSELRLYLISPNGSPGTRSLLIEDHTIPSGTAPDKEADQSVGTNHFLGEPADGTWYLAIDDARKGGAGKLVRWGLTIRGR